MLDLIVAYTFAALFFGALIVVCVLIPGTLMICMLIDLVKPAYRLCARGGAR